MSVEEIQSGMRTWTYDERYGVMLDGKVVVSQSDYTDQSIDDDDMESLYQFITNACNAAEQAKVTMTDEAHRIFKVEKR